MKGLLIAGCILFSTAAFSQEIPNVWHFRGTDTIRYSLPLNNIPNASPFRRNNPFRKYRQDQPFIIIPLNPQNSEVYRMPVIVPPEATLGVIPNPGLNLKIGRSIMGRK